MVRCWTFTIFGEGGAPPHKPIFKEDAMKFMVYQVERCAETGRLHVQGAVKMLATTRMSGMKKILASPTAHLSEARDWTASVNYCKKEETRVEGPWEWGSNEVIQGQRSDIEKLALAVLAGRKRPLSELCLEMPGPMLKYMKNVQAMRTVVSQPSAMIRKCCLLWGDTGAGKTRFIYDNFRPECVYSVFDIKTPWFDGYDGQPVVLFDECGPGMMCWDKLKRFTDRYPVQFPVKGGAANSQAEVIFLTSNNPMSVWWPIIPAADMAALERRIEVFHIPSEFDRLELWMQQIYGREYCLKNE